MPTPRKTAIDMFKIEAEKFRVLAPGLTADELEDFFGAVTDGSLSGTRAFLDKYPKLVNQPIINSAAPLMRAVHYQQLESARILLVKGADPNIGDLSDWTPLIWAARNGQLEMIELLLDFGAVVDRQIESSGITALMHAIFMDKTEAVRLLLEKGADMEVKTVQGQTAPAFAQQYERPKIVALFDDCRRRKQEAEIDAKAKAAANATLKKLKTRHPPKPPFGKGPLK